MKLMIKDADDVQDYEDVQIALSRADPKFIYENSSNKIRPRTFVHGNSSTIIRPRKFDVQKNDVQKSPSKNNDVQKRRSKGDVQKRL